MSLQLDTVIASVVTALIVISLAMYVRATGSARTPGPLQLAWEATATTARELSHVAAPYRNRAVATAVTLFWFILAANWLPLLPGSPLPAPTANINMTIALAVIVILSVHVTAWRARGARGYLRHYLSPLWLAPVRLLDELVKPITLALRLFGVLFASGLVVAMLGALLPPPAALIPHAAWMLFDMFMGVVQAFIFALLTILYFNAAVPADLATAEPATEMRTP
jgi:F-type H+-transporting ATPase subunit a